VSLRMGDYRGVWEVEGGAGELRLRRSLADAAPASLLHPANAVGRASRSGRAHPTYPRSRVLSECRSLSTACPPSPSQRTCSRDRSRWGKRERGPQRTGSGGDSPASARRAHRAPCPLPGPLPVKPPATLPLGAANHCHQHRGREDAKKPSSRKAPHPSAAPRHGGGGAPPPSRPAAGAAPAAAAAAAALARSGGGRRGKGRREGEERARERREGEERDELEAEPAAPRTRPSPALALPGRAAPALSALSSLGSRRTGLGARGQ
jgi:hypothetical protein